MCNENKDTARKEESHAEVTDSQRRRHFLSKSIRAVCQTDSSMRLYQSMCFK